MSDKVYCNECEHIEKIDRLDLAKCQVRTKIRDEFISREPILTDCEAYCGVKNRYGMCEDYSPKVIAIKIPKQSLIERLFKFFRSFWENR